MEKKRKLWNKKMLIAAGVSLLLACILEIVIFQLPVFKNGEWKKEVNISASEEPTVMWNLENKYVERLQITCACKVDTTYIASIYFKGETEAKVLTKTINRYLGTDVIKLNKKIEKIGISFPDTSQLQDETVLMKADTSFYFNGVRFLFFLIFFLIISFFLTEKKWFADKPENIFAVLSLAMGILLISGIGTNQMGFDEQIHGATAYNISYGNTVLDTEASLHLKTLTIPKFQNIWEKDLVEQYLNHVNDFTTAAVGSQSKFISYDKRSYLPISIFFKIGRFLKLSFAWMIAFGKFGNLLVYTLICFLAIKWAKQGKTLVAAIALIPNSIFTASSISYDGIVTCFLLLASVLVMNEFLEPKKRLEWKNTILMLGCFVIGSTAKQIYILLALPILFFSFQKFSSKIKSYLFKGLLVLLMGLMLYHILFPVVPDSSRVKMIETLSQVGDSRVSQTSVLGQIKYIIANPLGYTMLLLRSMFLRIVQWFSGKDQFLTYGYLGNSGVIATWLLFITLLTPAFVSPREEKRRSIGALYNTINPIVALGVSAVVWTSLYLSFNTVGNTDILGVQNRYFIPLFYILFSCLFNHKIKVKWNKEYYNKIIFLIMVSIHLFGIYLLIMKPYYL
ncbi:MAG TPA: DUF2142 domain-containing protein [Lachnospiraceae bacterium]|nr:DUF2142 domain-containing protein [Lachnospiraceae bacterium]